MIKLEAFSLADRVVQQLLEELLAGRLAPGTRLREIELADRLGVSRTPIREALGRLGRDGLVELLPNRGAIVRDLGGDELRHIYQLREALEGLAAELACERMTPADFARLDQLVAAAAPAAPQFREACLELDRELHRLIALRSGNPVLAVEIRRFHDLVQLMRNRVDDGAGALTHALGEHRAIIDALRGGDAAKARAAMTHHIRLSSAVAVRHAIEVRAAAAEEAAKSAASGKARGAVRALLLLGAWLIGSQHDVGAAETTGAKPAGAHKIDFVAEIQPLLSSRCVSCHGPEEQAGELRWDRRADALKGGAQGPAIVPGKSAESLAVRLIAGGDDDGVMPPEGERLSRDEIALFKAWIDQGAVWPAGVEVPLDGVAEAEQRAHWSFQPLVRPAVPDVGDVTGRPTPTARRETAASPINPIDAFIRAKLLEKGLRPSPEAEPAVLVRRLKFDLLGLPPTPEETANARASDYAALVEKYLASPHFGERWARHWLDVVRFAESNGFETNRPRANAWPYRDYVIQAFNDDKPYDRFVMEQLAGDQLGVDAATGFLVAGAVDVVKSKEPVLTANQRADELHDMVSAAGSVFMGLTVGCARCHNHKFDPVSQTDYYAMKAVFAGVKHGERAWRIGDAAEREQKAKRLAEELTKVERDLAKFGSLLRPAVSRFANEERFAPVETIALRFTVLAVNNGSEPCLDELEVFTSEAQPRNVALASFGTTAKASGSYPRSEKHKLEHVNDGQYGNSRSWISSKKGEGAMTLLFPRPMTIDRVVWSRDRAADGRYTDRIPSQYVIEVQTSPGVWKGVASGDDRLPYGVAQPKSTVRERPNLSAADKAELAALNARRGELQRLLAEAKAMPMVYAGRFENPEPTFRFHRGDPMQSREPIAPGGLAKFGATWTVAADAPEYERRLALARWIVDPKNPLTARVIVNRLWQHHFGRGLVDTPSDFGLNGARTTHPELLDWLAAELIDHAWSLKHVHRLIVTSETYKQKAEVGSGKAAYSTPRSDFQVSSLAIDADNQYLWRYSPRRLEAEPLRDAILFVSGNLDLRRGGPGFDLFEPNDNYVKVYQSRQEFGPDAWRRMIYQAKPRMQLDDVFGAFDCPDAGQTAPKRSRSTTPLQALNLLNSPFLMQQASLLAERVEREAGKATDAQIAQAFRLTLGRAPEREEFEEAATLVKRHGLSALCRALLNSNEFLYVF